MLSFTSLTKLFEQFGFTEVQTVRPCRCYRFYNEKYGDDFHIDVELDVFKPKFVLGVEWINELDWDKDIMLFNSAACHNFSEQTSLFFVKRQLAILIRYTVTCK